MTGSEKTFTRSKSQFIVNDRRHKILSSEVADSTEKLTSQFLILACMALVGFSVRFFWKSLIKSSRS